MMQNVIEVARGYMRHHRIILLSAISSFLLLLCMAPSAMANYLNLGPGQSKTIDVRGNIDTVFVSNPSVADYKILSEKRIIVYAKASGLSEITLYDNNSKILSKVTLDVDIVTGDLTAKIKSIFPDTSVNIKRMTLAADSTSGKGTYIISGKVPNEEVGEIIYQIVGEAVGVERKEYTWKQDGGDDEDSIKVDEIIHMQRVIYKNIIKQLTYPAQFINQVNVQLTIVEVSKEFTDSLGISWSQAQLGTDGSILDTFTTPGTFNLVNFKGFDAKTLGTTIKAIKDDTLAKVLAQPNLTVISGESAEFLVGGEVPITVRDIDSNTVSTSYKPHGIMLKIAPKVLKNNKIRLTIANSLSSAPKASAAGYEVPPSFDTRKSTSTIELDDGQSFVIAGLLTEEDREELKKIPLIGDIPILGALARSTSTTRIKKELVIFATVNLVRPVNSVAEIEIPTFNKTSSTRMFFNVGMDKAVRENRLDGNDQQLEQKAASFLDRGGFVK